MIEETNYPKNLKYPYSNYLQLVEVLSQLSRFFELDKIHPNQLHYLAYQQTNKDSQSHNMIYLTGVGLKRRHSIECIKGLNPIVNVNFQLELYPNNCTDANVETAIKKAVSQVLKNPKIKHLKIA